MDGKVQRILSLRPTDIHERCPIIMGCPRDVQRVLAAYGAPGTAGAKL